MSSNAWQRYCLPAFAFMSVVIGGGYASGEIAADVTALFLATRIGLIDLIARGYGWLAWAVIAIYAVPLLSLGTWRIFVRPHTTPASGERVLPWTVPGWLQRCRNQ